MAAFKFKMMFFITLSCSTFLSCTESPVEKVEDASEDVLEAKAALEAARQDSIKYVSFKTDSEKKLDQIDQNISNIKARKRNLSAEMEDQIDKVIQELELQKVELQENLRDYKSADVDAWESFKFSFNERLNTISKRLTELQDKIRKK